MVDSVSDAVNDVDAVFTMLPSSPQVEEVYLGENGLAEALGELDEQSRKESLFVDCTTLDQGVAKEVAVRMRAIGADMVDAPVSGGTFGTRIPGDRLANTSYVTGVVGADAGTLSFMVGGPEAA